MKILHVLDHSLPIADGYAFRSDAILRGQRALGWQTVQVTGPKHPADAAVQEEIGELSFRRVPAYRGWMTHIPAGDQLGVIAQLRAHLKPIVAAERPDVIHAHSPCLIALAALGLGPPVVYELRSSWEDAAVSSGVTREGSARYRASRALETSVLRRADAVATICEGLRADVLARGVPADRVTVVPNAVTPSEFKPPSDSERELARNKLGLDGAYVLGFIGSFFAWEGLSQLVEAMPAILEREPDARVLLVGGGNEELALRQQVARAGLGSKVIFAGRVNQREVTSLYAAVDALVYPRLPMRLTEMVTPLKPLEAMALGRPVIASNVGGHREMIQHHATGMLFEAGSPASLANVVIELRSDPKLQQRLREQGLRYVEAERTWERVIPRYAPLYARVRAAR
jgi:PEP-CTERM/exosortase A-associated glycosyltransferase